MREQQKGMLLLERNGKSCLTSLQRAWNTDLGGATVFNIIVGASFCHSTFYPLDRYFQVVWENSGTLCYLVHTGGTPTKACFHHCPLWRTHCQNRCIQGFLGFMPYCDSLVNNLIKSSTFQRQSHSTHTCWLVWFCLPSAQAYLEQHNKSSFLVSFNANWSIKL